VADDLSLAHLSVSMARYPLGEKRFRQLARNYRKYCKLRKFISISFLIRKNANNISK
jgi:hypothetical protein